jgi:hypothetical protein
MGARGLRAAVAMAGLAAVMGSASAQSEAVSAGQHWLVGAAAGRAAVRGAVSTVAGGAGGPARATTVSLWSPPGAVRGYQSIGCGVTYAMGFLYIADGNTVRKVNPQTDWLTNVAGTGVVGPFGTGSPAKFAWLNGPCGLAADRSGDLVIVDSAHNRVRVVAGSSGIRYGRALRRGYIYTVAGDGRAGFSGDAGRATAAELSFPERVAVDSAGNLVITDRGNERIRVAAEATGTFYGQPMTAGDIYTVAGDGFAGPAGDGGPATSAQLNDPNGVTIDSAGNVVFADGFNNEIRLIAEHTGVFYGQSMTTGDMYTIAGDGTEDFSGDGVPATSTGVANPQDVAFDAAGNLLIADWANERIRVVAETTATFYGQAMTAGNIYTIAGNGSAGSAGDGGPATSAQLNNPNSVTVDGAGNVVIADYSSEPVKVVAEHTGTFYGQAMTAGDIYTVAGYDSEQFDFSGDGNLATRAQLNEPLGAAADRAGNLVLADWANSRVRVIARATGRFYGRAMTAGDIYTVAGIGVPGFSGDGGLAIRAGLDGPDLIAIDHAGNLLIADEGNQRIRVVAETTGRFYGRAMTAGHIYTVAGTGASGYSGDGGPATRAGLRSPAGVAVDRAGDLVIADSGDNRIRVVAKRTGRFYGQAMTAGDIYTVAGTGVPGASGDGGPATAAQLNFPLGIAFDKAGNLVSTDTDNNRVRVVAKASGRFYGRAMTAGHIYTIAGTSTPGYSGDGGLASAAELNSPQGIAFDGANLVIIDSGNNRARLVAEATGTFYGQPMKAGDIYTIAGTGRAGFAGDGRPGTTAELDQPSGVAVIGGNLLITDTGNNRLRMIAG